MLKTQSQVKAKTTRKLVTFALKYKDNWHTFACDHDTIDCICGASNLKLIQLNEFGQFKALEENAQRYLNN